MRADARDGGLAVLEGDRSLARPTAGRRDHVGGGEEGIERDEVGVIGGDGHRRVVGILGEQATFPGERLWDGDRHAITCDGEAVDGEASRRALCAGRQLPFGASVLSEGWRELTQVGPERLEVGVGLPTGSFDLPVDFAGEADVGKLLAQDAEASWVDVELGVDGHAAGEVIAGELQRRSVGGVGERAAEKDAGLAGAAGRIQDEPDRARGQGAGIFRGEFKAQGADVSNQVV